MALPLMQKATAVWLVENTTLTFRQIAEFCGLHELEVNGIADGEVAQGIKGFDPLANRQLTAEEIRRGEADPKHRLRLMHNPAAEGEAKRKGPRYTPLSKRQDRPAAIAWLVKFHPELSDGQIAKLVGTTKPTIQSIRDRSHWNIANVAAGRPGGARPLQAGRARRRGGEGGEEVRRRRRGDERRRAHEARLDPAVAGDGAGAAAALRDLGPRELQARRRRKEERLRREAAKADAESLFNLPAEDDEDGTMRLTTGADAGEAQPRCSGRARGSPAGRRAGAPPSTASTWPVTKLAAGEARNSAASATLLRLAERGRAAITSSSASGRSSISAIACAERAAGHAADGDRVHPDAVRRQRQRQGRVSCSSAAQLTEKARSSGGARQRLHRADVHDGAVGRPGAWPPASSIIRRATIWLRRSVATTFCASVASSPSSSGAHRVGGDEQAAGVDQHVDAFVGVERRRHQVRHREPLAQVADEARARPS